MPREGIGLADLPVFAMSCRGQLASPLRWRHIRARVVPDAGKAPEPARPPPGNPTLDPPAELLRRIFAVDVLECPRCGGRLRSLRDPARPPSTLQSSGSPQMG